MKKKKLKEEIEKKKDLGKEIGQGFFEDEEIGLRDEIRSFNPVAQRLDQDFFRDESNVVQNCYHVKYKEKKNEEVWQILHNKKLLWEISGTKLNETEKKYLRSVPGTQFLLFYLKNLKSTFLWESFYSALQSKI